MNIKPHSTAIPSSSARSFRRMLHARGYHFMTGVLPNHKPYPFPKLYPPLPGWYARFIRSRARWAVFDFDWTF